MTVEDSLRDTLTEALAPSRLAIANDSHLHAGHAEAGGESHFRVEIVSQAFAGKSRIDRQRMVYGLLAEALAGPVHALSISALTPEEDDGGGGTTHDPV